jgi:hypothetical protein
VQKALDIEVEKALINPAISIEEKWRIVSNHGRDECCWGDRPTIKNIEVVDIWDSAMSWTDYRSDVYEMWDDVFMRWMSDYCLEDEDLGPLKEEWFDEIPEEGNWSTDEKFKSKLEGILTALYIDEGLREVCYFNQENW